MSSRLRTRKRARPLLRTTSKMKRSKATTKRTVKGGKVLASGGYGCVFRPALQCAQQTQRPPNHISKLMTARHTNQEFDLIQRIQKKLSIIPHYQNYFLIYDVHVCKPAPLAKQDLEHFEEKCTALPKDGITHKNVNRHLDELLAIHMPDGGQPIDDYLYDNGSFQKANELHQKMVLLLKKGILPMNAKGVYHSDIKDSNLLVSVSADKNTPMNVRLIDWGLSVEYKKSSKIVPKNWKNRPLQFNVPFSVILFTDLFRKQYEEYLEDHPTPNEVSLRPFVLSYLREWMKDRGAGHYKFINEIVMELFSEDIQEIPTSQQPTYVETEITLPLIVQYITDILLRFTNHSQRRFLERKYLNEVFTRNVDIWGFICSYYPMVQLLHSYLGQLTEPELVLFRQLKYIYTHFLFECSDYPISAKELERELNTFGENLIDAHLRSRSSIKKGTPSASSFERKKHTKHFQNPYFFHLTGNE